MQAACVSPKGNFRRPRFRHVRRGVASESAQFDQLYALTGRQFRPTRDKWSPVSRLKAVVKMGLRVPQKSDRVASAARVLVARFCSETRRATDPGR